MSHSEKEMSKTNGTRNDLNGIGASNGTIKCTVMRLWEGKAVDGRRKWLTQAPAVSVDDAPIEESPQYAISILHKEIDQSGKQEPETIILRGQELRDFLEETIPGASSMYNEEERGIVMAAPFRPLFWHLEQIDAATKSSVSATLQQSVSLLSDVLHEQFRDILTKQREMVSKHEINFNVLWTLFKPGITCITGFGNDIIAVKVTAIKFSRDPMGGMYYRISHDMIGWDGEHLGWQDAYTDIYDFSGRRKITTLDIFPAAFMPDSEGVLERLVERGRRFIGILIKEPHMMSFNGEALDREISPMWWQGEQKKQMSERVVIDARAYNHYSRRLYVSKMMKRSQLAEAFRDNKLDRDTYLYSCTQLHCFVLQRKKWARVWIDDLEEVVFNEQAYSSLVLPRDHKELLLSFAEAQIDGQGFDDVIAGKGQGILMLLAGPPGTGKTLTAEAIAEHMKRPLYYVSAGELGASAGGMEHELDKVLELCTRWNAILLLDEADVFLERRTDNDMQRNAVVSVFLRKLEYYRGIMFLTTNRAGSFDEAFKSRIHIAIKYPDLDATARRSIWVNFLKSAEKVHHHGVQVSDSEIDELSQRAVNGREIRNIVKSAQLLASRAGKPLSLAHLEVVWRVEHEESAWR